MDIGGKIKELLLERKMSNLELSKIAGVPNSTLADILKGKTTKVSINAAISIADALGVTVEYLIYDDNRARKYVRQESNLPSREGLRIGHLYDKADDHDQQTVEHVLSRYDEDKKGMPDAKYAEKTG